MKKVIVTTFFALFLGMAMAQTRTTHYNNIGWVNTFITPRISDKWSAHIEYQFRRADWGSSWQQGLLRVGLNYKLHQLVTAQAGYGWILTYPYGEYNIAAVGKVFPEHRLYEQLTINNSIGKVIIQHRLRLEQRWLGKLHGVDSDGPDEWVYMNRVRYMPRIDVPVYKQLYMAAFDEVFIGFGKKVGENIFDQNRISGLVGYKVSKLFRLEAGYINQTLQLGREVDNKNVIQSNSGFLVNSYLQF